jgi:hypothetical protein
LLGPTEDWPGGQVAQAPPGCKSAGAQHLVPIILPGGGQLTGMHCPLPGAGDWPGGQQPPLMVFGVEPSGQQRPPGVICVAGHSSGGRRQVPVFGSGSEPGGQHRPLTLKTDPAAQH